MKFGTFPAPGNAGQSALRPCFSKAVKMFHVSKSNQGDNRLAMPGDDQGRTGFHLPDAIQEGGFRFSHGNAFSHFYPPIMDIMTILIIISRWMYMKNKVKMLES